MSTGKGWVLEVTGRLDERALQEALGGEVRFRVWPYASLGDFIVQVDAGGAAPEPADVIGRLRSGGWGVLGGRKQR